MTTLQPFLVNDTCSIAASDVQSAVAWDRVYQAINAIAGHRPESEGDFDSADQLAVAAALSTARWYQAEAPALIPDDVFMMPDGGLMIEWGLRDGTVVRLDFAPGGKCQLVITYADGRDAVFEKFVPPLNFRRSNGGSQRSRCVSVNTGQLFSRFEFGGSIAGPLPAISRKAKIESEPKYSLAS